MVRRVSSLPLLVLMAGASLAASALAGDRAEIALLGFSDDGRYFAFEEYGVQDGSGFPYATIYALDLAKDAWIAGAPFKTRIEDETATLGEARAKVAHLASGPLGDLAITEPASFLALNGDGEPGTGRSLRFGTPGLGTEEAGSISELALASLKLPPPGQCAQYTSEPMVGFALTLDGETITADTRIPDSRGCPLDYRIYGVVEPAPVGLGPSPRVAIISVYSLGFEGPDRRFIAVPLDR